MGFEKNKRWRKNPYIFSIFNIWCKKNTRIITIIPKEPPLRPGTKYGDALYIPALEEGKIYDVKQITRYLGKRNTAATIFTSLPLLKYNQNLCTPSIQGIMGQSRKQRERILKAYLSRKHEIPYLEDTMWHCFPTARKTLLQAAISMRVLFSYLSAMYRGYKPNGNIDGELYITYLDRSLDLGALEQLNSSETAHVLLTCKRKLISQRIMGALIYRAEYKEEMSDTEFRPLSRYIQFLGMDRIIELNMYEKIRRLFCKSFYLIINKPEQLLDLSLDYLEQCIKHPLWDQFLYLRAFQLLLSKHKEWYPDFFHHHGKPPKPEARKETKELYSKADFLIRHMPKPTILGKDVIGCPLLLICLVKWPSLSIPAELVRECISRPVRLYSTIEYGPKSPVLYANILVRMGGLSSSSLIQTIESTELDTSSPRVKDFLDHLSFPA